MQNLFKIGFGGGCHWCTEAVFQSLKGVAKVQQGWIASTEENMSYPEFCPVRDFMWVEIGHKGVFRSAVGTKCFIEIYMSCLQHFKTS